MADSTPETVGIPPKRWLWLLAPVLAALLLTVLTGWRSDELTYSGFKQLLKVGKVKDLALSEHLVSGTAHTMASMKC